jgi:hypothetical protein
LRIETVAKPGRTDTSFVEATVYSSHPRFRGPELSRCANLLIRALKAYLMASEKGGTMTINPTAIRNEIWGEVVQ